MLSLKTSVSATALALAFLSAQGVAAETLNTPRLSSADNFRDIAGTTTAYSTARNGVMRQGVFYRSNALTLSDADLATVNTLGISDVYDLRTPGEVATAPDRVPTGASYTNVNLMGNASVHFNPTTADEARAFMQDGERAYVNNSDMRGRLAGMLNDMAAADGASLFHCTAGKDRTGWTAAVLQSLAGVSDADIMTNYLATNDYTADRVAATMAYLNATNPAYAEIMGPVMGVEASYLQAGLDEVASQYGTMQNYLTEGLGLSQETIYVLRGKMVRYSI